MAVSDDSCAPWDPSSMGVYLTDSPILQIYRYCEGVDRRARSHLCLSAGIKFLYVLPGFDILGIERHIKVKGFGKTGKEEDTFDMFIKNDTSLLRSYPTALMIKDLTVVLVYTS